MQPPWLLLTLALTLANGSALAQQPVRPLLKVGGGPLGYYASGSAPDPTERPNRHRAPGASAGSSAPQPKTPCSDDQPTAQLRPTPLGRHHG
jgi:hypothetical protein